MATLKGILADKPPPWLAKVMGKPAQERIRFEPTDTVSEASA